MNKMVLTLAQKYGYANIIMGLGFLILILFKFSDNETNQYIGAITNFLCSVSLLLATIMKSEIDDERSIRNLGKSAHLSLVSILAIMAGLTVLFIYNKDLVIANDILLRGLLGIGYLLYGSLFLYFEKAGY